MIFIYILKTRLAIPFLKLRILYPRAYVFIINASELVVTQSINFWLNLYIKDLYLYELKLTAPLGWYSSGFKENEYILIPSEGVLVW